MANLLTKYGLPLLAVGLIVFAVIYLARTGERLPTMPPPMRPAESPFANTVAGAGMVEPETESISVGALLPGVVVEVMVKVGQTVRANDPLFRLDDRELQAELRVRRAMLADATAAHDRLAAMPRPEELPQAEARVRETKADWENWEEKSSRSTRLVTQRAISDEDAAERKHLAIQARERYNRAIADFDLLKAGSWEFDKRVAAAAVDRAEAQIKQAQMQLERLVTRALVDCEVLQINVRPGEFVGAQAGQALLVLGNVTQLHVRVDIDEYDIPRFVPEAPARATLKGQPDSFFPITFVRFEPYVVPKKSLTGDNTERVDTRVLQVIYAIDARGQRLFVGQQLDVFFDASPTKLAQALK